MKTIDKQEVSNAINQKSEQLGYELGSALSYNSFATLISPEYPIAFIGLNPGGNKYDKPTVESENSKCAYNYENWTAKGENKKTPPDEKELDPLQRQIIKLYTRLAEIFGCDYKTLMDKSIMANLVPFRSPSWNELPNQKAALEFSSLLWSDIFKQTRVKVIICMSVVVFYELDEILRGLGNAPIPGGRKVSAQVGEEQNIRSRNIWRMMSQYCWLEFRTYRDTSYLIVMDVQRPLIPS